MKKWEESLLHNPLKSKETLVVSVSLDVGVYKNISEKRIYIHPNEIKRPPLYSGCEEVSDSEMDEQGYSTYLIRYLVGYRPVGTGTHIDHWALRRCTECEANGGSKNKPSFWPNDHQ